VRARGRRRSGAGQTHAGGAAGRTDTDENEAVLGVDVESTPLIVPALFIGLGLAGLLATGLGRRPAF